MIDSLRIHLDINIFNGLFDAVYIHRNCWLVNTTKFGRLVERC